MAGIGAEREIAGPLINPNLVDFWNEVLKPGVDGAALYGGRSSSKTRDTACCLVHLVDTVPVKIRVLCIRRFQNRIQESVYTELKWAIQHLGLSDRFIIQKTTIIHRITGSEFIFYGIERNLEDIKGTSEIDILWCEEAEKLTADQWKVIEPTIRKEDSLAIMLFNPNLVTDFVWKEFVVNTPPNWVTRQINYDQNPFLSKKAVRGIKSMEDRDPDGYRHIYLGIPKGESELSIFRRKWLDACIDAHKVLGLELTGRNVVGFDPADDGEDACATAALKQGVFAGIEEWHADKDQLPDSAKRARATALQAKATLSYDTIGVGAFVGGYVDELNRRKDVLGTVQHVPFNAGGAVVDPDKPSDPHNTNSVKNRDEYLNRKAQAWGNTARKAMMTFNAVTRGISIPPSDVLSFSSDVPEEMLDALFVELCVPEWVESEGKKRVEPKKQIKKIKGVKSHNLADAVIAADNAEINSYSLDNL
ncbi:PBSX family phage terminase large subunit [Roseibium alexandrii]|uniref:PBSX family phage terminase large subunit n=1 Tax=Roseibium alexandrii TaxID=388408 RepID=UPI003752EBB9